ncbi:MAG: efflux RND transporter permease subunit [Bradyrhizobium sp.]|nr:efflux RND transporter permease subunit [Bradyrhizobium sp.]
MNLGRLSINQPILAMVLSIVLLIVGAIAYTTLPVSEYPQVVPPTVVVTTQYPGATAQTVSDTVAAPIEQEINGVEDMLYLYSQATSSGQLTITVTFKLGTDLDKAQVLVQNRVAIAQPRLPEEVQRNGVVTRKNSPDILMVVFMLSPDDSFDQLYISNYALLQVRDQLLRVDGIGDIQMFGARDYSMRLWLDPDKIATRGMTSGEVLAAIRAQNLQITGGQLAEPPITDRAFQPNLTFTGRLKYIKQFEDIVVRAGADGRTVRLRDVARVELGALAYTTNSFLLRKSAVALLVTQRPGSNALATANNISNTMTKLKADFPKGLDYNIGYNPTEFIAQSVSELIKTIYEAMFLVVIVVLVFLQGWRPAIIPIIAIPVSLVGTFAVMAALGFSINNLTLFGLVLAVGIVVDDAIVVVENVERHLEHGMSRRDAALKTMEEVGSALVSIALVLCAVFVPTAFLGGISGQFFQQFAVTIAVATAISCFCSLTLSPALASLILVPHAEKKPPASWNFIGRGWDAFTGVFNRTFDRLAHGYASAANFVIRHTAVMLLLYVALIGSAGWLLATTPQGFIPAQDRGYVIVSVQLPGAASLARTTEVVREIERIALDTPGIIRVAAFAGFSGATRTQAGNAAALFPVFEDPEERSRKGLTSNAIAGELRKRLASIEGAFIIVIPPPAVPGIGTGGGFAMRVQDRQGRGSEMLAAAVGAATSRLTGDACQPYGFHWAYDTHALAVGTGGALVQSGGDSWFFLTADYAFGHALEKDTGDLVKEKGGKVLGAVRIPLNSSDFSSFLLQAQSSKAKIIGLANAGLDTTNSIKQAAEFGIVKGGQKLAGLLLTLAEVHGLGLEASQGLVLTEAYYWDRDDKSRDLANRFFKRTGRMPNMIQAGTYSATLQYLKAVKAAGTKDTEAVAKKLKELPVDDLFAQGKVLENGRMVHDLYLFEVKKPSESKKPWDYYKQLAVVPGDKAFPSAKDSGCPLTK